MKIEYRLPFRRTPSRTSLDTEAPVDLAERLPRIARLLALAHRLDVLVRSGEVSDYATLARLGHISPARLTQLLALLHLSPAIQEYVLFLPPADSRFVTELTLRNIAREPHWDRQQAAFERILNLEDPTSEDLV